MSLTHRLKRLEQRCPPPQGKRGPETDAEWLIYFETKAAEDGIEGEDFVEALGVFRDALRRTEAATPASGYLAWYFAR